MLQPKRTKFRKAHKGRIHGNAPGGTQLNFGSYGLKALEPERITARLGDSDLPTAPVEGGSWGAASSGAAVQLACRSVAEKLFQRTKLEDSFSINSVALVDGQPRTLGLRDMLQAV